MKICKRCGTPVEVETELDYPYYCPECDENMYEFEVTEATHTESVSYGELAEIQQFAKASIEYWSERRGNVPANPDEAEMAVRCAYGECWIDTDEPWKHIEERLELIINQIGLMVEDEQ